MSKNENGMEHYVLDVNIIRILLIVRIHVLVVLNKYYSKMQIWNSCGTMNGVECTICFRWFLLVSFQNRRTNLLRNDKHKQSYDGVANGRVGFCERSCKILETNW